MEELMITNEIDGKLAVVGSAPLLDKLGLGIYSKVHSAYLLDVSEVAYIIFKKLAIVKDAEGEVDLQRLFIKYSRNKYDWIKFTVLTDLRNRGRKTRSGFSQNTLIYEWGNEKMMVFVTEENSPITANELVEWIKISLSKGYQPIVAVVDAHGDVTYYTMHTLRIEDIEGVLPK